MTSLADIAGLGGYVQGQQVDQQQQLAQAQQMGMLQRIAASQRQMGLDQAFRSDIAKAQSPDEQLAVAAKYMGPDALGRMVQSSKDRQAQIAMTHEAAMTRIQAAASNFEQTMQLRYRQAATAEEKAAIEAQYKQGMLNFHAAAQNQAGQRLLYDTGIASPTVTAPQIGAPGAPAQAGGLPPNVPPSDAAAYAAALAGGSGTVNRIMSPQETAGMTDMGAGAPPAAPAAPVNTPPVPVPQPPAPDAGNLDARDIAARAGAVAAPVQAPVAPAATPAIAAAGIVPSTTPGKPTEVPELPPEIARLPKKQQDAWLVQNAGGGIEQTAQGIADYKIAPLSSFAMARPLGAKVMGKVMELNPNYDSRFYPVSIANEKAFTSGKQGDQIRSFNVAINHLNTLKDLTVALQNNDIQRINQVANQFAQETGQTAPTNFDAAKTIVGDEITKAIIGAKGALGDREQTAQSISRMNSPQQLTGVISTFMKLMGGQLNGLEKQYESGTRRKDFRQRFLTPESLSSAAAGSNVPNAAPQAALDYLKANPDTKDHFKAKFGYLPDGF